MGEGRREKGEGRREGGGGTGHGGLGDWGGIVVMGGRQPVQQSINSVFTQTPCPSSSRVLFLIHRRLIRIDAT